MPAITLTTLQGLKQKGEKITMLTCYDATFAHACNQAGVEVLLVGDSLGMVLQGHDSTLPVTTADMAYHVACVKRGNQDALILADMAFNASRDQGLVQLDGSHLFAAHTAWIGLKRGQFQHNYALQFIQLCNPELSLSDIQARILGQEEPLDYEI